MLLRSVRAHLWSSAATFALAVVVSAGSVGVVGASRVGGTPGAVAAMLALYGGVALAEQTARSVVDRSHDIALARLRGSTGSRLVAFAAAPLLVVTLVGVALGSLAGVAVAGQVVRSWGLGYAVGAREVAVAVAVLAGAWATVALVASAVIRRPLVEALSTHPRRHPSSWVTTFLELLVVAAACLAVYEAHRSQVDWVPTVAPALVALAAGQLVMWALLLTPRIGRRLGVALTSRRLRRDPAPGSVLRILVAAAVLLSVTLTGGRAAADWRDDAGRLRAGGPLVVPFAAGGLRAYAAAHDADPRGRWLMAAVAVDDLSPSARRVYVDSPRWDAVVGDFFRGTSVAGASSRTAVLARQPRPLLVSGGSLAVDVGSIGKGARGSVAVSLLTDRGYPQTTRISFTSTGVARGRLASCRVGCSVISVDLEGAAYAVRSVSAGGTRIVGAVTHPAGPGVRALALAGGAPQAALTTPGLPVASRLQGLDGRGDAVRVLGSVGAVPFLGRAGWLLDLGRVLRGAVGTVAGARSVVVARADTPASVLAALRRDGGGHPSAYGTVAGQLDHTPQARGDALALLMASGVALVALVHLVAWLIGQAGGRRAEVAGLRAAGVHPRAVRGAYLVEASILAGVVLVAAAVAAAATTVPLLQPMRLAGGWADAPVLRLRVLPLVLGGVVLAVAVVTAVVCAWAFTRFGRAARPAALRAAER